MTNGSRVSKNIPPGLFADAACPLGTHSTAVAPRAADTEKKCTNCTKFTNLVTVDMVRFVRGEQRQDTRGACESIRVRCARVGKRVVQLCSLEVWFGCRTLIPNATHWRGGQTSEPVLLQGLQNRSPQPIEVRRWTIRRHPRFLQALLQLPQRNEQRKNLSPINLSSMRRHTRKINRVC